MKSFGKGHGDRTTKPQLPRGNSESGTGMWQGFRRKIYGGDQKETSPMPIEREVQALPGEGSNRALRRSMSESNAGKFEQSKDEQIFYRKVDKLHEELAFKEMQLEQWKQNYKKSLSRQEKEDKDKLATKYTDALNMPITDLNRPSGTTISLDNYYEKAYYGLENYYKGTNETLEQLYEQRKQELRAAYEDKIRELDDQKNA